MRHKMKNKNKITKVEANGGIRDTATVKYYMVRHYLRRAKKGCSIYGHSLKHSQVEKCSTSKIPMEF